MLGSYGRLGNQMFQYATLKSVADRNGYKYKIPPGNYSLKKLNIKAGELTHEELKKINKEYRERWFHYDDNVFDINDWTSILGYFQSSKYFNNIKKELYDEFDNKLVLKRVNNFIDNSKKKVSIHVRRTDYLGLPKFHPFPGLGYYRKCIKYFKERFECNFYICSDDIDWCRRNFIGNDYIFSGKGEVFDLLLMMSCDHNILANSSFSWWGAYLNKNKNKIIKYPKVWFGHNGPKDSYDLVPKGWEEVG
jgi:hypothetical protein